MMANPVHVKLLQQGSGRWNMWREKDRRTIPDLSRAELSGADLSFAWLFGTDLSEANLSKTNLVETDLHGSDLRRANLSEAFLGRTNLSGTNLSGANLRKARLHRANLSGTYLREADLSEAFLFETIFAKVDLRTTKGLTTIFYFGPSHIELFSVLLPQDGSARHFLRGVGVPENWSDYYCANMFKDN